MHPRYLSIIVGVLAATAAWACPACGDKLSIVGGGVEFEDVGLARLPGSIVVYAPAGSPLQASGQATAFATALKDAGHEVRVVDDATGLERVAGEMRSEIVLAHWSESSDAAARIAAVETQPTVMPVTLTAADASAAKAAGAPRCVTQADGRGLRKLPQSVDGVLERRRKGQATGCPIVLASRTN